MGDPTDPFPHATCSLVGTRKIQFWGSKQEKMFNKFNKFEISNQVDRLPATICLSKFGPHFLFLYNYKRCFVWFALFYKLGKLERQKELDFSPKY
jgi:hypothetical protein